MKKETISVIVIVVCSLVLGFSTAMIVNKLNAPTYQTCDEVLYNEFDDPYCVVGMNNDKQSVRVIKGQ